MIKSIHEEVLEKAWNLVHNKYPENNEEIQLVRYAIKIAMELTKRIGELEKAQKEEKKLLELYKELLGPTRKLWPQIKDIENQIEELEK